MNYLKPIELQFWQTYLSSLPHSRHLEKAQVTASVAGDERNADELLQLYLDGKKTAGSGLLRDYEMTGDPIPMAGHFWIILDSSKKPKCIVKTKKVEIHTYEQVPERIAVAEGEGDLSLKYWKDVHAKFFEPYLKQLGIQDLLKEKIVTEFFEVVFKD